MAKRAPPPASPKKRPHRATGKPPPGGKRAGAGRPKGRTATKPHGTRKALMGIVVARRRLGAEEDQGALAQLERVYERVIEVLEEKVEPLAAGSVLKAAAMLADAVAGPLKQRVGLEGADGGTSAVSITINAQEK